MDFTAGTYVLWAQQVSNLCCINPTVKESFKFHIFLRFTMLNAFTKFYKIENNMKSCLILSVDH